MRRRVRKKSIDADAAKLLSDGDVFVISMGWLWSLRGFAFLTFCTIGLYTGLDMFDRYLHRQPVSVDGFRELAGISEGRVVAIKGALAKGELAEFETIGKHRQITLGVLDGSERSVVLAFDGALSNAEKERPLVQEITGMLMKVGTREQELHGTKVDIRRSFAALGVTIPDGALVIAHHQVPEFRLWHLIINLLCLAGCAYVVRRTMRAWRHRGDRELFYQEVLARVQ